MDDKGRKTDTVLGHLTLGEIIIPMPFAADEDFLNQLNGWFSEHELDINEFIVGNKKNKINPETGHPEFFFKKIFRKVRSFFSSPKPDQSLINLQREQLERAQKTAADAKAREDEADAAKADLKARQRLGRKSLLGTDGDELGVM